MPHSLARRLAQALKLARGKTVFYEQLRFHADDTFLASFPKSGNTWLRFIAAHLLHPEEPVDFSTIAWQVPDTHLAEAAELEGTPRPRVLKTHRHVERRMRRVVYLVRDPRDVCISLFHYSRKTGKLDSAQPVDVQLPVFARAFAEADGWAEHVGGWLGARHGREGFLLLRYEDLLADAPAQIARLADFLGVQADWQRCEDIAAATDRRIMQKQEQRQGASWQGAAGTDQSIPFVRKGTAGGWRQELPAEAAELMERRWKREMARLGYLD